MIVLTTLRKVIWDTDQQPSILHRPDLSLQNALVTGKVIVHRGATITLKLKVP